MNIKVKKLIQGAIICFCTGFVAISLVRLINDYPIFPIFATKEDVAIWKIEKQVKNAKYPQKIDEHSELKKIAIDRDERIMSVYVRLLEVKKEQLEINFKAKLKESFMDLACSPKIMTEDISLFRRIIYYIYDKNDENIYSISVGQQDCARHNYMKYTWPKLWQQGTY